MEKQEIFSLKEQVMLNTEEIVQLEIDTLKIDALLERWIMEKSRHTTIDRDGRPSFQFTPSAEEKEFLSDCITPLGSLSETVISHFSKHHQERNNDNPIPDETIKTLAKSIRGCGIYAIQKGLEKAKRMNSENKVIAEEAIPLINKCSQFIQKMAHDTDTKLCNANCPHKECVFCSNQFIEEIGKLKETTTKLQEESSVKKPLMRGVKTNPQQHQPQ